MSLIRSLSPSQAAALAVVVEQEMDPEAMSILNMKPKQLDADQALDKAIEWAEKRQPEHAQALAQISIAASLRELVKRR